MKIVADLHLHSKYSRAVSPQMEPEMMARWAKLKGIDLLGTGDWTHPLWLKELESKLEEIGEGIYKLKGSQKSTQSSAGIAYQNPCEPSFFLSTEISSIYSQGGKGRRIHNLVLAPSFETVHKINYELKRRGCNLLSDGRPIVGLSSIELCELVWSIDESCLIIPCHVWTPWFSLYGSKSGFDSIEECFGKFAEKIYAVETGLSSDPEMNWRIKELDHRAIVSFGDSHSPAKLGREATVFGLEELSYKNISEALRSAANQKSNNSILYTIEFYPEEGKYHYSGHRNCKIKQTPGETREKGTICPVCGRPLTLGVMHRVEELAGRQVVVEKKMSKHGLMGYYDKENAKRPPYVKLVPLMEILAESLKSTVASIKVKAEYEKLTQSLAPEFEILTQTSLEKIAKFGGDRVAEGIDKVRKGEIVVDPGFDGVFGIVKIWSPNYDKIKTEKISKTEQASLF